MSEVSVKQLAEATKTSVDKLISQLNEAGIEVSSADDSISDEQKMALLTHLRSSHGKADAGADRKITLKRKRTSELKVGSRTGGKKTVNIVTRKKKTFVKTPAETEAAAEAPAEPVKSKVAELAEQQEAERKARESASDQQKAEEEQRKADSARKKEEAEQAEKAAQEKREAEEAQAKAAKAKTEGAKPKKTFTKPDAPSGPDKNKNKKGKKGKFGREELHAARHQIVVADSRIKPDVLPP